MIKIKQWLYRYRLHLFVWTLYITYECVIAALILSDYGTFMLYVTHYIIIIALFYIHANVAIPYALNNRLSVAVSLPLIILLELGLYLAICFADDKVLEKFHQLQLTSVLVFKSSYILRNLYRSVYFIGFSTGYYFLITYNKERTLRAELEKHRLKEIIWRQQAEQELTKAHNAFLKAQINPHFLFNTLDFIYHHIMEVSPVAAEAIIMLSDMMRFATDADKMGEYIPMSDEIEQVTNLQFLNQMRKNEKVPFSFTYSEEATNLNFIPLVLLTLTENIFKHGHLTPDHPASLDIRVNDGMLVVESNNMSNRQATNEHKGTGLANIGQRLAYAYGSAVSFNYGKNEEGQFNVLIMVPVQLLNGTALPLTTLAGNDTE